jgi:hypothetical protein
MHKSINFAARIFPELLKILAHYFINAKNSFVSQKQGIFVVEAKSKYSYTSSFAPP